MLSLPGCREIGQRRVFVMRHGIKEENVHGTNNMQLQLLPEGEEALAALREFLHQRGLQFSTVLCSPYLRCRQTVDCILPPGNVVPVVLEPGLAEVLNSNHGMRGYDSIETLKAEIQQLLLSSGGPSPVVKASALVLDDEDTFTPRGVTRIAEGLYLETMHRAHCVAQALVQRVEVGQSVLCVGHGASCFGLLEALVTGAPGERFDKQKMLDMTAMAELEETSSGWRLVGTMLPRRTAVGIWEVQWSDGAIVNTADQYT